nr:uncharacterized protein LOC113813784 [Penaeus vannamei]
MKLLHCLLAATLATTWCAAFPQDVSHPPNFSGFKAPLLFPNLARPWQGYQRTSDFGISPVKDLGYPPHNEFEYPPVNGFNEFAGLPETNFLSSDLQEREVPDEVSPESQNTYSNENAVQVNSENVPNPFMFEAPQYSRIPETIPDFPNHNFNNFPIPYALEYIESLATRTPRFPFPYIPEFPVPASPPSPIIPNFLVGIPEHLTPKELPLNNILGFPVPNTREFQFDAVQRFPALNNQEFPQTVPSYVREFPFWNFPDSRVSQLSMQVLLTLASKCSRFHTSERIWIPIWQYSWNQQNEYS